MSEEVDEQTDADGKAIAWPSVDDVKPAEEGGPAARKGFNYQDEVAVSFLLDMLEDPSILKVHCETHDDILLIRGTDEAVLRCAEYVQVKAAEADKLWSLADLCKRKDGKEGTSIFEKSLTRDAHKEVSRFRILTLRPVVSGLKVLALSLGAVGRESGCKELAALRADLESKLPGLSSPKGNGCTYWLENCYWDQRHDEEAVRNSNRLRIFQICAAQGKTLLPEPAEVILDDVRAWVKAAGAARWVPDRDKKIITREALRAWWEKRVAELTGAGGASGGKLVDKMKAAHLPDDVIGLAVDLRRRYSEHLRTPRYADAEDTDDLLDRVNAEAISLRSRYVAGQIDLSGTAFHSLCLDRMDAINAERPAGAPNRSAFLKGCLYDIADRCLLRFEKLAP